MNLCYKYPIIFWNCACLISDSGGDEKEENNDEDITIEENYSYDIEDFNEDDNDDEEDDDEEITEKKKKKKTSSVNFGKIATAIGKMKMAGINVEPPDINKSSYTFSPDAEENIIRYGMSGISRVGEDLVKTIISNRPYVSFEDFLSKVKVNKLQAINLIKSGAFDSFGNRESILHDYILSISDQKKRLTLQNMKMLIDFGLIPDEYDFQRRVYNFNKYLKKFKNDLDYQIDNIAFNFIEKNFNLDILKVDNTSESGFSIKQTTWDNIYKKQMEIVKTYVQKNNKELLEKVNNKLFYDQWDKYCFGNISKWEMDSISFYSHPHELNNINLGLYGISNFFDMDEEPVIDKIIPIKGKNVPLYKLYRIAGTVLDRDKAKKTVNLLTTEGVVSVKIYGVFQEYDKQISMRGPDGKKHVIEKSMFQRGNKIIVTGIRQDGDFLAKVYSKTPWHRVEQITDIKDGHLIIKTERATVEE